MEFKRSRLRGVGAKLKEVGRTRKEEEGEVRRMKLTMTGVEEQQKINF